MANKNFENTFKGVLAEAVNHLGEPEYQLYSSWIRALRKKYPDLRIEGNKDIAQAFSGTRAVGEWDGATGSIFVPKVEKPVVTEAVPGEVSDSEAWSKSLAPTSNPDDFNTAENPQHAISHQNIEIAKQWVSKIDEFKKFINGLEPDSLHVQLNNMDRDGSSFRGIVKAESKRLIKIAEALGGFNEILRSYIIGSDKKARDLNAQTSKSE